MKFLKTGILLLFLPLLLSAGLHKFYVSTTSVEYAEEEQSLQLISKIFIDDIEDVLEARNQVDVHLDEKKETQKDRDMLKAYVLNKLNISVNNKEVALDYLGIEYDIDIVKVFIEIQNVPNLESIEIDNKILMDLYDDQQNIIHIKTPKLRRSLILDADNPKGMLNFD